MRNFSFFLLVLAIAHSSNSQTVNNPLTDEIVNFSRQTKKADKRVPIDKPFLLTVDKIDLERVESAFAYKIYYYNAQRKISPMKKDGGDPDISLKWDTVGGKLLLFFPALRPNVNFDISIHLRLSDGNTQLFLQLTEAIQNGSSDGSIYFDALKKALEDPFFGQKRTTLPYDQLSDFKSSILYASLTPLITAAKNDSKYGTIHAIPLAKIFTLEALADAAKISLNKDIIFASNSADFLKLVSKGLLSFGLLNAAPVQEIFYAKRIANIKSSIGILQPLRDSVMRIYLKNGNGNVKDIVDSLDKITGILTSNLKFLQGIWEKTIEAVKDKNYEAIWLVGSTESQDLLTKGGSLMSTEIGLTNIWVKNNIDKTKYIPRLYWGLNIFFRPVDRNTVLRYLPRHRPKFIYPDKKTAEDELSATRTILHQLTLSIGLTIGALDQPDFDNLYSGMSLTVGPSYRFARAFRISTGLAVLKRKNSNPLLTDKKVTTGVYASFSVDFDLIQSVKNFTNLILK